MSCVVCNVQISDEHIRRHSPSCFQADLCPRTLEEETSSTQCPCLRTCSMVEQTALH